MKVTSAEANRIYKELADNKRKVISDERNSYSFNAASSEDPEALRPDYNFSDTESTIDMIDNQIMKIKHALNVFNSVTRVGETGLTIDQVLIRIPQLSDRLRTLDMMRLMPKKQRRGITGNVIDYTYANFDPSEVMDEYKKVNLELHHLQDELDKVNNSITFEI